jgi:hypothetical protein
MIRPKRKIEELRLQFRRFDKRNEICEFIYSRVSQDRQDQGAASRPTPSQNESSSIGSTIGAMSKDTLR